MRTVIGTLVLRLMDEGRTTVEAGARMGICAKAAWEIGRRYYEGGLERAIYDAPRPGQKPPLNAEHGHRPAHCRHSLGRSTGRPARTDSPARLRVQALWHSQRLLRRGTEGGTAFPQFHSRALGGGFWRLLGGDRGALPARPHHPPGSGQFEYAWPHGAGEAPRREAGQIALGLVHSSLHTQARQLAQPG